MTDATRYPLSWPFGWKRTDKNARQRTRFKKVDVSYREGRRIARDADLTIAEARRRLELELERLRARDVILSTNVELTSYGEPRSGRRAPEDPGVAVYFRLRGKDRVLACDKWTDVAGNIAAIAAHIDCIRGVDRYGVGTLEQAFAGYDALPAPGVDNRPSWRKVLGLEGIDTPVLSESVIRKAFIEKAKNLHPDTGGSTEAMAQLNLARDEALREIGGGT